MILQCTRNANGRTGCALYGCSTTVIHFNKCAYLYAFTVSKESRIVPDAKDWTDSWGKRLTIISGEARKTYFNL